MTFDQLIVFIKIVDTGSYRKAAEALYRSQPAMTQSIKKLEESLNIQLFTRDGYRSELTDAGEIFVREARGVVHRMQHLKILGQELGSGYEARIGIAIDIICPEAEIIGYVNRVLSENSPHTELFICTEVLAGARERLLNHDVDFAIMPLHTPHNELIHEPLTVIEKIAVAAPDYMPKTSFDHERELIDYRQIILTDSAKKMEKLTRGVIPDAKKWYVSDINLKKTLILQGLGWGYLPKPMVDEALTQGDLVPIYLQGKATGEIPLCLIRHYDHPLGPLSRKIWNELKMHMKNQ